MIRDALVVGINLYKDDNLRNLKAPASDAEATAQILEQYGEFQVWRLPEAIDAETKKPLIAKTRELNLTQLKDALVKLFKPEGRQVPDTALFYFSGHGIREDKGIQEGFLATSDVFPQLGFNGLSLQWLRRLLQESPVRQQIIWLDCCHSGELLNFDEADPGEQGHARDRCFIASSREFEQSLEDLESSYSVLTKFLLSGLDPNRYPQQWVTNYSLVDFINKNLRHENQRPVFTNFGSPINLTRTWDREPPVSKGQDSQDICPYKGLQYFDCNDEDPKYFYGREKLTDKLLDRVKQSNFLAILGASGSGKSSVLRAGLLHQLKLGRKLAGSQDWKIQIMFPGEYPLQNLALSWLSPDLSNAERAIQLDQIESLLKQGGEGLRKLVQASTANRLILVIDQFEEAFTLCQDLAEREAFFQCLLEALEQTDNKLCLILAMRIDFFGKCFEREYSGLGNKIQTKDNFIAIPPMKREELKEAIIKPAEKVNLSLESGLAEEILKEIEGSPASLPLLQDTLTELWKRRKDNQLKFTSYSQLGGIGGTLNQRATEVYKSLSKSERDCAKHIFLGLTQLGEGTEDTRRRVLKRDLFTDKYSEQLVDSVVKRLADEKLIVTSEQINKSLEGVREVVVDVAHETLIRHWQQLRQWVQENREAIRIAHRIDAFAEEWQSKGKSEEIAFLLQGSKLSEFENFLQDYADLGLLSSLAQEFIQVSQDARERLQQEEEARQQRELAYIRELLENEKKARQAESLALAQERKARQADRDKFKFALVTLVLAIATMAAGAFAWQWRQQVVFRGLLLNSYLKIVEPKEAELLLKHLPNLLETADTYKNRGDIKQALSLHHKILRATGQLQRQIKEEPEKFPKHFSGEIASLSENATKSLVDSIRQKPLKQLEQELKNNRIGGWLISGEGETDMKNRHTEGALQTTYKILMEEFGAKADFNGNDELDSKEEAEQIPCETLKDIEKLWRYYTDEKCGWYGSNFDYLAVNTDCKKLDGFTLTQKIFIFPFESEILERLNSCQVASPPKNINE